MAKKDYKVSEDTQLHMSTTYTRNGKGKKNERRSFNFVIKGLLISTSLVGSLLLTGGSEAVAYDTPNAPTIETARVVDAYQDESAMISNLKMATNILEAGIKNGQINMGMYDTIMKRISAIDTKLTEERQFNKIGDLIPVLEKTDKTLKSSIKTNSKALISKRQESIKALTDLQEKFGLQSSVKVSDVEPVQQAKVATVKSKVVYNDFKSGAYWANDMLWAIDKGMISGYQNQKHPTNKNSKVGNWLNPNGNLTEIQMLAVMFRYFEPEEVASRIDKDDWWGTGLYELADQYKIKTTAGVNNKKGSGRTVTRGEAALAIAAVHYGKPVNLQTAVDLMYESGASTGTDQTKPKTLQNYNPDGKLLRAHIVAFMSRYNDFISKQTEEAKIDSKPGVKVPTEDKSSENKATENTGGSKSEQKPTDKTNNNNNISNTGNQETKPTTPKQETKPSTPKQESKPSTPKQEVKEKETTKKPTPSQNTGAINTKHGSHDYGSANQAEYDEVMRIVNNAVSGYKNKHYMADTYNEAEFEAYFNGQRGNKDRRSPEYRTKENAGLIAAENAYGELVDAGISVATIKDVAKLRAIASDLLSGKKVLTDNSPKSAYDGLVRGVIDCDPIAEIQSAVFDAAGYNTMIVSKPGHATAFVQMEGKWISVEIGFQNINPNTLTSGGWSVHTPPTR